MSDDFKVAYKRLKKRHRSLEADFERLLLSLLNNPNQGVENSLMEHVRFGWLSRPKNVAEAVALE